MTRGSVAVDLWCCLDSMLLLPDQTTNGNPLPMGRMNERSFTGPRAWSMYPSRFFVLARHFDPGRPSRPGFPPTTIGFRKKSTHFPHLQVSMCNTDCGLTWFQYHPPLYSSNVFFALLFRGALLLYEFETVLPFHRCVSLGKLLFLQNPFF